MKDHISPEKALDREHEVRSVASFFATEGRALHEILDITGEFDAAAAAHELVQGDYRLGADLPRVTTLLEVVLEGLRNVPYLVVEHAALAGLGPRDLHAAFRWYGARLEQSLDDLTH